MEGVELKKMNKNELVIKTASFKIENKNCCIPSSMFTLGNFPLTLSCNVVDAFFLKLFILKKVVDFRSGDVHIRILDKIEK